MEREKDILAEIDKADPTMANSRLSKWMRQNHDAFAARVSRGRIVWSVLVKVFTDAKLVDARGNPPTEYSARKTWQRVRREVKRAREKQPPALLLDDKNQTDTVADNPQKPAFGTATPRGHNPAQKPAQADPVSPPVRPPPTDADRVLKDFLGDPPTSRFTPKGED